MLFRSKGWMKDQEGWTQVTKRLRTRMNDLKGLRYKGSKQYRDPMPKRRPKLIKKTTTFCPPRGNPRQVINIKANKVIITNQPDPSNASMSNNYYSVLDFDDNACGRMYQPKFKDTHSKKESWKAFRQKQQAMREHEKAKQRANKARRDRRKKVKANARACVFATGFSNANFGRNTWLGDTACVKKSCV